MQKISLLSKQTIFALLHPPCRLHPPPNRTTEEAPPTTDEQTTTSAQVNQRVIEEFRANAGRVGGPFDGAPLVLLTTTGARSGQRRTSPMMYAEDGDRILVFGSNGGAATDPQWFTNLLADPEAGVELPGEGGADGGVRSYTATALPLHGQERDRIYARQAELVPPLAGYQAATTRTIPVVALYRTKPPAR